jgi:hypothetical protein
MRLRGGEVHRWVRVCAAFGWLAAASCALLPVAGGMGDCSGALFARSDPAGAQCLERMVAQGGGVAAYLERAGQPDYFEISPKRVRLLYIERDQVVELSRTAGGGLAERTSSPIRSADHMRFRNEDRARLGQTRMSRVPASPAAVEERPNEVRRARVGERGSDPEPDPEDDEDTNGAEPPPR